MAHSPRAMGLSTACACRGKLTEQEFALMKKHSHLGHSICDSPTAEESQAHLSHTMFASTILGGATSPLLKLAGSIALTHHEKWDGSGYPCGLVGEDIPIEGRVTAVADVFDALSSKRPYKRAFPIDKCFAILDQERATHFDPQVVDAFFDTKEQILEVRQKYSDE